jgi:hypothetical protein
VIAEWLYAVICLVGIAAGELLFAIDQHGTAPTNPTATSCPKSEGRVKLAFDLI